MGGRWERVGEGWGWEGGVREGCFLIRLIQSQIQTQSQQDCFILEVKHVLDEET